jgi:hypothetical protein
MALLVIGGTIVFSFWVTRRDLAFDATELTLTQGVFEKVAEQLGLVLERERSSPEASVPIARGTYRKFEITIQPAYVEQTYGETGFSPSSPYHHQKTDILVKAPSDRHWLVPKEPAQPWYKETFAFWEKSIFKENRDRLAALLPPGANESLGLLSSKRRPLRVVNLDLSPRRLLITAEYVRPPKVRFRRLSFKMRTDPEDLHRMIDDIVAVAEALPSTAD